MKIKIRKEENEVITKMCVKSEELDFDYVTLVDALYNDEDVLLDIDGYDDDEVNRINSLFDAIKKKCKSSKHSTDDNSENEVEI